MNKKFTLAALPVVAISVLVGSYFLFFVGLNSVHAQVSCTLPQVACNSSHDYDTNAGSCMTPFCVNDSQCVSLQGTGSQCMTAQQGCANYCTAGSGGGFGTGIVVAHNATTATLNVNGTLSAGGNFQVAVTGPASTPFMYCVTQTINGVSQGQSCTQDSTNFNGGWTQLGTFASTDVGSWQESVTFQDAGQETASTNFNVLAAQTGNNTSNPGLGQGGNDTGNFDPSQMTTSKYPSLSSFLANSPVFAGVYWTTNTSTGATENGIISDEWATEAAADWLASEYGGTAVQEAAPPPACDPAGCWSQGDPPQWFVQLPGGDLVNAGSLAEDYWSGSASVQIGLFSAADKIVNSFKVSPNGSAIVSKALDPQSEYAFWVLTDADGYTWQPFPYPLGSIAAASNPQLQPWGGSYVDPLHGNPDPNWNSTTGSEGGITPTITISSENYSPATGILTFTGSNLSHFDIVSFRNPANVEMSFEPGSGTAPESTMSVAVGTLAPGIYQMNIEDSSAKTLPMNITLVVDSTGNIVGGGSSVPPGTTNGANGSGGAQNLTSASYNPTTGVITITGSGFGSIASGNYIQVKTPSGGLLSPAPSTYSGSQITALEGSIPAGTYQVYLLIGANNLAPTNAVSFTVTAGSNPSGSGIAYNGTTIALNNTTTIGSGNPGVITGGAGQLGNTLGSIGALFTTSSTLPLGSSSTVSIGTSTLPVVSSSVNEDLQNQIAALQAEVLQLQAELAALQGNQSSSLLIATSTPPIVPPPGLSCHSFMNNLSVGSTGFDVTSLQVALSLDGETVSSTGSFDDQTAAAVTAFQEKYASAILAPEGLTNGTGYVGSATRAELNKFYGCSNNTPTLTVSPGTVSMTTPPGTWASTGITLNNTGSSTANWSVSLPNWILFRDQSNNSITSGSVAPGQSQALTLVLEGDVAIPGQHSASMVFSGNFPTTSSSVNFTVSSGGGASTSTPVISSITPTLGPIGTQVTIMGSGFTGSNLWVNFGEGRAINPSAMTVTGDNMIRFAVPSSVEPPCAFFGNASGSCMTVTPVSAGIHQVVVNDANGNSNIVNFTVTGSANLATSSVYDVNGDGVVNGSDYAILENAIFGPANTCGTKCDVNGDGNVNVADLQAMTAYLESIGTLNVGTLDLASIAGSTPSASALMAGSVVRGTTLNLYGSFGNQFGFTSPNDIVIIDGGSYQEVSQSASEVTVAIPITMSLGSHTVFIVTPSGTTNALSFTVTSQ